VVRAALAGELDEADTAEDPVFGLAVPTHCPGVPSAVLQPRQTWADPAAYDEAARALAQRFADNFEEYADSASDEVRAAGPRLISYTR
jgi:phosphoenolpyruvate carboxykinase (ATP)